MKVLVGTSGYAYKEWKGTFYPEKLPADEFLSFYASKFRTVEINNTFYRMPTERLLQDWAGQVPDGFVFVLKAPQKITHIRRLKECSAEVEFFTHTATTLGEKLGPTLVQLPPNMKKDLPRLVDFLALFPKRWRVAVEFRHVSWLEDDVYAALKERDAALCMADTDENAAPAITATASWGYLRLRSAGYDATAMKTWASLIQAQPWTEAYAFFKHELSGPEFAEQLQALL